MNIMLNKTEKFVTQLRHATRRERRNTANYPNISWSASLN